MSKISRCDLCNRPAEGGVSVTECVVVYRVGGEEYHSKRDLCYQCAMADIRYLGIAHPDILKNGIARSNPAAGRGMARVHAEDDK